MAVISRDSFCNVDGIRYVLATTTNAHYDMLDDGAVWQVLHTHPLGGPPPMLVSCKCMLYVADKPPVINSHEPSDAHECCTHVSDCMHRRESP